MFVCIQIISLIIHGKSLLTTYFVQKKTTTILIPVKLDPIHARTCKYKRINHFTVRVRP